MSTADSSRGEGGDSALRDAGVADSAPVDAALRDAWRSADADGPRDSAPPRDARADVFDAGPADAAPDADVAEPDLGFVFERAGPACRPPQELPPAPAETFVGTAAFDGLAAFAGDIDGDGVDELVVELGHDPDRIFHGVLTSAQSVVYQVYRSDGGELVAGRTIRGVALLAMRDLDGDGVVELIGREDYEAEPNVLDHALLVRRDVPGADPAYGADLYRVAPGPEPWQRPFDYLWTAGAADVDADGAAELWATGPFQIYQVAGGQLRQTFVDSRPGGDMPGGVSVGDFDQDGAVEIVSTGQGPDEYLPDGSHLLRAHLRIWEADRHGSFRLVQQRALGVGDHDFAAVGDPDGDGRLNFLAGGRSNGCLEYDLYVAPDDDTYLRIWSLETLFPGSELDSTHHSVAFGDTDGDGDDELALATDHAISVFEWDGHEMYRLFEVPVCAGCATPTAWFADFDGDGRATLVVSAYDTSVPSDPTVVWPEGTRLFDRVLPDR
jgi:hypothetical protein